MAQGLINNGVSVTKNFTPNELELLVDYEVKGSAVTQVDFTSLNIQEDEEIVLKSTLVYVSPTAYGLAINGNTTETNYYGQQLQVNTTTISAYRYNSTQFLTNASAGHVEAITNIKLTNNGFYTSQSEEIIGFGGAGIQMILINSTSTFAIPSITSLRIYSASNAIGIGSRFQLYKVKGQVQQTWATT